MTAAATQIYQVFTKASPERVWESITRPEFTERYFHGSRIEITAQRRVSRAPDGSARGDSPVFEYDPPRRLVHEWRPLYDPDVAAEQPSRVSWEIEPQEGGDSQLNMTNDIADNSPRTAESVSGEGWMFVLSGLKTLLETGEPLQG